MSKNIELESRVWGPHYWFFFHTIALTYPKNPNTITKKKYYEFIQNIPMFIPLSEMANTFSELLNEYPVVSYLDNRETLTKWFWFIHNKINEKLEKKQLSIEEFYDKYYEMYRPVETISMKYDKIKKTIIYFVVLFALIATIFYYYNQ
jgi:hypothetical protein